MNPKRLALVSFLAAGLFAGGTLLATRADRQDQELAPLSEAPDGVDTLLYARPFVLDTGYTHWFRKEQPTVRAGWLLVLAVDPELARPRETWNKILYVGDQTAERVNHGTDSGRIVVLVPSALDERGLPALDLASAPIFFGGPELPERIDEAAIQRELAGARAGGVAGIAGTELAAALAEGGALLRLHDRVALEQELARVILRFSPDKVDADIARGLSQPVVR